MARYVGFLALKAEGTPGAHPSALCLQATDTQGWLNIWGAHLRGKRAAKIEILNIFYREHRQGRIEGMSKLAAVL